LIIVFPEQLVKKLFEKKYDYEFIIYIVGIILIPFIQVVVSILFERINVKINQSINMAISKRYFTTISDMDCEKMENPEIKLMQETLLRCLFNR